MYSAQKADLMMIKNDRGGRTNYGVTQRTYNAWRQKKGFPSKDVLYITKDEAKQLYYEEFWKPSGASEREDLRESYLLFDTAVISGPYEAKRLFRKSNENIYNFLKERKNFHKRDIERHPEQKKWEEGWMNRLRDLESNMNEIVNNGYYNPPYKNNKTPYDINWGDINLKKPSEIKINNKVLSDIQLQNIKNKYQYIEHKERQVTGKAVPIEEPPHIFSQEEIGKMTQEEFARNEATIMEQLKNGQIIEEHKQKSYGDLVSADSNVVLYTREDIANMSTEEFTKHEKAIRTQMNKIGIPSKRELPQNTKTYSSDPKNGKWVTINGNHIFIDK